MMGGGAVILTFLFGCYAIIIAQYCVPHASIAHSFSVYANDEITPQESANNETNKQAVYTNVIGVSGNDVYASDGD